MNSTHPFTLRAALWIALSVECFSPALAMADVVGRCVPSPPCYCDPECYRCGPGGCGSPGPTIDHEAEVAERQRKAEEERRRQEAEAAERQHKAEEEFRRERDAAAGMLKGSLVDGTPELKGLAGSDSHGLKSVESRVGRQLKSVEGDSHEATLLDDKEAASKKARGGFDNTGGDHGALVIPGISGKKPATPSALAKKIDPRALQDPQIQKSLAWYEQLEKVKTETLQKLAEVQQQKKSGTGDKAVLAAHEQSLNNQIKDTEVQQVKTEQDTKKRVKNLGLEWNEAGTATAGDKSGARK